MRTVIAAGSGIVLATLTGCASSMVEPGHRGLLFDPKNGGLQHEVLQPGYYRHGICFLSSACPRVDDFDVTYSRRREEIHTTSQEGLALSLTLTLVYRPIVAELYQLDTEIGPSYYDEVVGPEFRSAARGVFARHPYLDLQKNNENVENEIEQELRRRTAGRHMEVSSVLIEAIDYAPEIANAVKARLVGAEESARLKAAQENEGGRKKRELEIGAEQERLAAESAARQKKLVLEQEASQEQVRLELELAKKKHEKELAEQQAQIDKLKAEGDAVAKIAAARGEATARIALAQAQAAENRAEASSVTPMQVMMHAYDALGKLGGSGTNIMLGDWSKVPNFLFPRVPSMMSGYTLPWSAPAPPQLAAPSAALWPTG